MKKVNTKRLVILALLVALNVVLGRFCSFFIWSNKIGFGFVPVFVAAYLYGPLAGGVVGALGDLLGATLFPVGPYFPGFTVTAFLMGVVLGLLLYKKQSVPRTLAAVGFNQLVLGLGVNTLWIAILYGSSFGGLLLSRVIQCAILIPVEFLVITFLLKTLFRRGREVFL